MNDDNNYLKTNNAGKLVSILEKIQAIKPADNHSYSGWCEVFETPKDPIFFTLRRIENLINLISNVYDQMNKSGYPKAVYDSPIMELYELMSGAAKNMSQGWNEFQPKVSKDKIAIL